MCPIGTESSSGFRSCASCTVGSTVRVSFSQHACQPCPLNSVCNSVSGFTCNAGYEISGSGLSCQQCSLGFSKSTPGNGACSQCAPGTESASDRQSCVACASGYYRSSTAINKCVACPFAATCSASAIIKCANGFKINAASDNCEQCPIGQHSTDGLNCVVCPLGSAKPSQDYDMCFTCPSGGTCSGASVNCPTGYTFDANVQCKRNDTYFALMQTGTQTATSVISYVTIVQTSTSLLNQCNSASAVITATQTVTVSPSGQPGQQQAQSANSVTIDFIGTLPISPLIFGAIAFGSGLLIMLVFSLICCRRSTSRRIKDDEFDGGTTGMATSMNTASQQTYTNGSNIR